MDSQRFNLTKGDILGKLLLVAVPIIGTQLMLMCYNLVDMFLLGRVDSDAVAASGAAGMYMWLGGGLALVGRLGAEIGVAQCVGRRDKPAAEIYARNALFLSFVLGLALCLACVLFTDPLVGFLNIIEDDVRKDARDYLFIVAFGMPAFFVASAVAGVFTGAGNSRAPFFVNAFGLVLNALLDPLFIFTFGMEVRGAAVATAIAQNIAVVVSVAWLFRKRDRPFKQFRLFRAPDPACVRRILAWSVPVSVENMLFTFFSMLVTRYVAGFGASAIAVFRVGAQAESLGWLVCLGFSSGVTTFVGQNYGAGQWRRIWSGVRLSLVSLCAWGVFVTLLFFFAGRRIVGLLVPDPYVIEMGASYLRILAFCQVFFCLECIGAGAFRGLGRTAPPSIASIVSNALRVPMVYLLSRTELGLDGVWVGISLGASIRGLWVAIWFWLDSRKRPSDGDGESAETDHPA